MYNEEDAIHANNSWWSQLKGSNIYPNAQDSESSDQESNDSDQESNDDSGSEDDVAFSVRPENLQQTLEVTHARRDLPHPEMPTKDFLKYVRGILEGEIPPVVFARLQKRDALAAQKQIVEVVEQEGPTAAEKLIKRMGAPLSVKKALLVFLGITAYSLSQMNSGMNGLAIHADYPVKPLYPHFDTTYVADYQPSVDSADDSDQEDTDDTRPSSHIPAEEPSFIRKLWPWIGDSYKS